MKALGDFDASAVIYGKFTTFRPSTGAAFTLAGTPALSVYKDNSVTQSTTGVTLTADFDSVTGLNHFAIDTSADGTFYSAGSFFDIVITTGTVDSVSVVGSVVASFTIRKTAALKPTTAGRALDVSAGGEAGVDWANVGSPTTAVDLSGTTIKTTQKVDVDTIKTNPVVNGGTITFPTNATVASTTNLTAGTIAAVSGAVGSVTGAVGSVTGNVGGNVTGSVGSVTGAVGSVTGNVGGPPTVQVEPEEQASNWQAHYHYPRNRRLTKEEERRQRIALGIIEEEFEAADEAVKAAAIAEEAISRGIDQDRDISLSLEAQRKAKEDYLSSYREAFREEYRKQILELWAEEVTRRRTEIKRRTALLLLLS
jgi:hypothetical protein